MGRPLDNANSNMGVSRVKNTIPVRRAAHKPFQGGHNRFIGRLAISLDIFPHSFDIDPMRLNAVPHRLTFGTGMGKEITS